MATGKRYYWIKLKESFLTSDTVDFLMEQPNGANYVVLYQTLCLKTINTGGKLSRQIGEVIIPYDAEKIARDCKWFSVDTIRVALKLYQSLGLIYEDQDGVLALTDHENLVGSETDYAAQKRLQRGSIQLDAVCASNSVDNVHENVHTDIDNRYKDNRYKEKEENTTPQAEQSEEAASPCPFGEIWRLYHSICVSYPKILHIDGQRRKAVAARWRANPHIETFEELFGISERSAFLKGKNSRNWSADFDWMMNATNFSKILEHKYDDKHEEKQETSGSAAGYDLDQLWEAAVKRGLEDF